MYTCTCWICCGHAEHRNIFFCADAKSVQAIQEVEALREKVYASLEEYCKANYPDEPGRFAKLLLRLPALRSIGLKCVEHLFALKLLSGIPLETYILDTLERNEMMS